MKKKNQFHTDFSKALYVDKCACVLRSVAVLIIYYYKIYYNITYRIPTACPRRHRCEVRRATGKCVLDLGVIQ